MNRHTDGTFEIAFGAPPKRPHRESGQWKVQGDAYMTITLTVDGNPVDPRDPQYVDLYKLQDLTSNSMSYLHLRSNILFKSIRIPCPDAG